MKRFILILALALSLNAIAQVGYTWRIAANYDEAGDFKNGLAIVKKDGLYGAISVAGTQVIPFNYTELNPFTEKITSFKHSNGKVGIIDAGGKVLCEKDYDKIFPVSDSCAKVLKGDYGFINAFGKEVVPCKYGNLLPFNNNMTYFFNNLKYGFYDTKGTVVVPLTYTNVGTFTEGLCAVSTKDKWGYIDTKGKLVIPMEYEDAGKFSEGLACVQKNGKFGFIDKTGELVIPYKFDTQGDFVNGFLEVFESNDTGNSAATYYDKTGKKLFSLQPGWWSSGPYSEGYLVVADGHYFGFLDKAGMPFVMEYEKTFSFKNGIAAVKADGFIGFINNSGFKIIAPQFDMAGQFSEGLIAVKKDGKWGYIAPTN